MPKFSASNSWPLCCWGTHLGSEYLFTVIRREITSLPCQYKPYRNTAPQTKAFPSPWKGTVCPDCLCLAFRAGLGPQWCNYSPIVSCSWAEVLQMSWDSHSPCEVQIRASSGSLPQMPHGISSQLGSNPKKHVPASTGKANDSLMGFACLCAWWSTGHKGQDCWASCLCDTIVFLSLS